MEHEGLSAGSDAFGAPARPRQVEAPKSRRQPPPVVAAGSWALIVCVEPPSADGGAGRACRRAPGRMRVISPPTVQDVDGGDAYYGTFSSGLPTRASYFPIAVWGSFNQTRTNRDLDAAAGINTYVWVADDSFMDEIRADGRFRVIQDQTQNRSAVGSEDGRLGARRTRSTCSRPTRAVRRLRGAS